MADRPPRPRRPLADTTEWVNNQVSISSQQPDHTPSSPSSIPHHESLRPGGTLQIRNEVGTTNNNVEDKRLSAITNEEQPSSKRDSQISAVSTNASGPRRKRFVGPWNLGRTIGKGGSGRVRKARHIMTGQEAAVKIISKKVAETLRSESIANMDTLSNTGQQRDIPFGIEREVVIMKLIEHPNIIKIFDVWENRGELYLVLEYVEGGELFNYIEVNGRLPEYEAVRIFRQMIAGLSYCQRFNICHRDLKPENILLDGNRNVKIVDFGMAALQPAHKLLITACGSPHYASPEIIMHKQYRGDKADIWSCGVILYAMLTGVLPFGSGAEGEEDYRAVMDAVVEGYYTFPRDMSKDARDLIWRMLQMDPQNRISMNKMWQHPLLKQYEYLDSLDSEGKSYTGPTPALKKEDCGEPIQSRADIDGEMMRNLKSLWHGLPEEELAGRLLSDTPNLEKVMYRRLLKFREEQLEDYDGPPIGYSASDHHHVLKSKLQASHTRTSLLAARGKTQQPRFSVLDETAEQSLRAAQPSLRRPSLAETEKSYDPYRSSRRHMSRGRNDHARVTVIRDASSVSRQVHQNSLSARRPPTSRVSVRDPALSRVRGDDAYTIPSSSASLRSSSNIQFRNASQARRVSRGSSRISLGSNHAVVRKSFSYKRNVAFAHPRKDQRKGSTNAQRLRKMAAHNYSQPTLQERFTQGSPYQALPSLPSSPPTKQLPELPPVQTVRSRKSPTKALRVDAEIGAKRTSNFWKEDTRKVSTELGKFCDEVFNRASVNSSMLTGETGPSDVADLSHRTPATSVSALEEMRPPLATTTKRSRLRHDQTDRVHEQRPLPAAPSPEHIGSFAQRELARTRDRLKQKASDADMPGYLDDVIAHLDRLMQPSTIKLHEQERRAISTPTKSPGLERSKDTFERFLEREAVGSRSTSEPTAPGYMSKASQFRPTVRNIGRREGEKPITPTKPLAIRKRSGASTPSADSSQLKTPTLMNLDAVNARFEDGLVREQRHSAGLSLLESSLAPIEEDEDKENQDPRYPKTYSGEAKRKGWFWRHHQANKSQESERGQLPLPPKDNLLAQYTHDVSKPDKDKERKRGSDVPSEESQTNEPKKATSKGRGRLFKIFGRRVPKPETLGDYNLPASNSFSTTSSTSHPRGQAYMSGALQSGNTGTVRRRNGAKPDASSMRDPPPPQPQHQNWLARFLRIKPATAVLCFQLPKIRARREIVGVLKEWRKYGMRDIVVDRDASRIWARVDGKNSLRIPPMTMSIQLYTVLEKGRRAGLSIARLTQERGAKSSFERVLGALEKVLGDKGCLVEEDSRREGMKMVLG